MFVEKGMPEVENCAEALSIVEMAMLGNMGQGHLREEPLYLLLFQRREVF